DEKYGQGEVSPIPGFVLEACVKDETFALLPPSGFIFNSYPTIVWDDQAHLDIERPTVCGVIRTHMPAGVERREIHVICHHRLIADDSGGLRAQGTVLSELLRVLLQVQRLPLLGRPGVRPLRLALLF